LNEESRCECLALCLRLSGKTAVGTLIIWFWTFIGATKLLNEVLVNYLFVMRYPIGFLFPYVFWNVNVGDKLLSFEEY
jgi:hypothetical protein